jgi:plastocyanin
MTMRLEEMTRSAAALVGLCAIAAAGVTASCFSERTSAPPAASCDGTTVPCVVEIRNFAFEPAELHVPAGATVTWVNREQEAGLGHSSTSDNTGWDSGILEPDASFSRPFNTAGQFAYHCEPHPAMKGTIVVE